MRVTFTSLPACNNDLHVRLLSRKSNLADRVASVNATVHPSVFLHLTFCGNQLVISGGISGLLAECLSAASVLMTSRITTTDY